MLKERGISCGCADGCNAVGEVSHARRLSDRHGPGAAARPFWRDVRSGLGADIHFEPISGSFRRQSRTTVIESQSPKADIYYN